jgi:8-oxo-dGTP pyrophosphatase MutT (NUDIX family)
MTNNPLFPKALPPSRLGQSHDTLDAFRTALGDFVASQEKEYTLVVVTESTSKDQRRGRILLGFKNRGFGMNMYNSFGGKFDHPDETVEQCASRELQEETNIFVTPDVMKRRKVGILRMTFEDGPMEMIIHLFHIYIDATKHTIQDCEEITPQWFDDWYQIPFDNMFADDSLWLTQLLTSKVPISINGWFHFQAGGQDTNTILDYYMNVQPKQQQSFTLEQQLFHKLHDNQIHSPSVKEFKEAFAFCNSVRAFFGKFDKNSFDVIIDVAGGHGALAALLLITTSAQEAIVIDPANVGSGNVEHAWKEFYRNKTLTYRYECLRGGLPDELQRVLRTTTSPRRVLVVACHACQHLSEEILEIACRFGVHVAVMPCCQKDTSPGSSWKSTSKNLSIPMEKVMDILLAGKMMAFPNYDVRMKCMDPKITPQNRIILCRPLLDAHDTRQQAVVEESHKKLETAYKRAHASQITTPRKSTTLEVSSTNRISGGMYLTLAFATGIVTALAFRRR